MNLAYRTRGPLGQKAETPGKDPAYLARVRTLPCCVCEAFGEVQASPTEAHHVFHGRFSQIKTPDRMAIPLCGGHHQGQFDRSKMAIHQRKYAWERAYGPDHSYTAATQDKLQ